MESAELIHAEAGIDLVPRSLKLGMSSEALAVLLVQAKVHLNRETRAIENRESTAALLDDLLRELANKADGHHLQIAVMPEAAIPSEDLVDLVNGCLASTSGPLVFIAGIETVRYREYLRIIEELGAEDPLGDQHGKDPLVNAAVIAAVSSVGQKMVYVQPKVGPSKPESTPEEDQALVLGKRVYYFSVDGRLHFTVLICSDFFSNTDGAQRTAVDEIAYHIVGDRRPLDFVFNIQRTPETDHGLFRRGVSNLFDDGEGVRSALCVVMLNAVTECDRGGRSRVMFWHDKSLDFDKRRREKVLVPTDMPVTGFEFDGRERLVRFRFNELPRSWGATSFVPVAPFAVRRTMEPDVLDHGLASLEYVEPVPQLDRFSRIGIVQLLAREGNHARAAKLSQRLYVEAKQSDRVQASRLAHECGRQHRHMGELLSARKWFAVSEECLSKAGEDDPELRLQRWRAQAGRVMLEKVLIDGDSRGAKEALSAITAEMKEYLKVNAASLDQESSVRIVAYRLHGERLIAEMLKYLGEYEKSAEAYEYLYDTYSYSMAEEKAYCLVGIGDANRMQAAWDVAADAYNDAMAYAQYARDIRMSARIHRNRLVLRHAASVAPIAPSQGVLEPLVSSEDSELKRLSVLVKKSNYRYGRIYCGLISGMVDLDHDPERAESHFCLAHAEAADEKLGRTAMEAAHARLGLAECARRRGDFMRAESCARLALDEYKRMVMPWGKEAARRSLDLAANSLTYPEQVLCNIP